MAGEGGCFSGGEGDYFEIEALEKWEKAGEFGGFTRLREGDDGIAIGNEAEVAVEGVLGIENNSGGACGVESGGDFMADVAGFPDADDHDFAAILDGFEKEGDRSGKIFVETLDDLLEGFDF